MFPAISRGVWISESSLVSTSHTVAVLGPKVTTTSGVSGMSVVSGVGTGATTEDGHYGEVKSLRWFAWLVELLFL